MKKIIFLISGLVIFTSQVFAQDTNKENDPDEQTIVNKEYDENGNLIQYDSTYVHHWSSADSTSKFSFPGDAFFSGQGFPDIEEFFKDFHGGSELGLMPDMDKMLQHFQQQFLADPDSLFNKGLPYKQSPEQQKEWQQLMEKQQQEVDAFRKKWAEKQSSK